MIRLYIIEDHELVRRGLKELIETADFITIIGESPNLKHAEKGVAESKPDVVLLDLNLPDGHGLDFLKRNAFKDSGAKSIILTSFSDDQMIFNAIKAGVDGYLLKDTVGTDLISAIEKVSRGECAIDPQVTRKVFSNIQDQSAQKATNLDELSVQEKRVVEQVAKGLTNKEIGEVLHLSDKTVKNYLSTALSKLGVSRRTEAAAIYWKTNGTP